MILIDLVQDILHLDLPSRSEWDKKHNLGCHKLQEIAK